MYVITYAYAAGSNAIRDRVEALKARERGQGTLEYLGLLILVAGIVTFIITRTNLGQQIRNGINQAVWSVLNLAPNSGSGGSGGGNGGGSGGGSGGN